VAKKTKSINLALQGGGSHGAFAWGVLDRLLEDERIEIEGVVGTSAGAMNAAVLSYGLTIGGNEGARARSRATPRSSRRPSTGPPAPATWTIHRSGSCSMP
jgi:NTE family protein